MRALVCEGPDRVGLREIATPAPGPGEVLVRVRTALTCGTDFKLSRRGHPKIPFPLTLGHEFAGVVESAGEDAGFQPGERVTSAVSGPCGSCAACGAGRENLCETAFERPLFGAFADFLLVPGRIVKSGLRKIPAELPDLAAALLDPLASVVHGLARAQAAASGNVLIAGTGPIAAMLFFLLRGKENTGGPARHVVVAGRRETRLGFFLERGAGVARIEDSSRAARAGAAPIPMFTFKENPQLPLFSLVVDTTGDPAVIEALPALAVDGGTVLLFAGLAAGARVSLDAQAIHYREVSIVGSFHYTPREADEALALLSSGAIPAAEIVSTERPLADWRAAFDLAENGVAMKVGLVP